MGSCDHPREEMMFWNLERSHLKSCSHAGWSPWDPRPKAEEELEK